MLVPCISVIDEADDYNNSVADWNEFRSTYPNRPFCLLVPSDLEYYEIKIPDAALNDPNFRVHNVTRDKATTAPDDWFELYGLKDLGAANVQSLGLFIDVSGSLGKWHIQNSYNKFLEDAASANLTICEVFNEDEDWISPFLTTLTPDSGECQEPNPHPYIKPPFSCVDASVSLHHLCFRVVANYELAV
jgi:hypothetical protein